MEDRFLNIKKEIENQNPTIQIIDCEQASTKTQINKLIVKDLIESDKHVKYLFRLSNLLP